MSITALSLTIIFSLLWTIYWAILWKNTTKNKDRKWIIISSFMCLWILGLVFGIIQISLMVHDENVGLKKEKIKIQKEKLKYLKESKR